mmetsp:Transcript_9136/g.28569  ORF Transcript_9136/g.28569 Transcript_9136/m.28569 type:complete len:248 (+) Transcript_9136:846-1589(+)
MRALSLVVATAAALQRASLRRRGAPRRATHGALRATSAPCSDADIAALFGDVPCFSLADADGQLVLLDDGKGKAIEFYVDVDVAVRRKQYWDEKDALTVKPLSLGKALAAYGGSDDARFVASPDELSEARRMFLECTGQQPPEDPEALLAAYEEADARSSFGAPTDVPLFSIDALRLAADEPAPWYFSSKDLLETWESASGKPREAALDKIAMMNLSEMLRVLKSAAPTKPTLFLAAMSNLQAVGRG